MHEPLVHIARLVTQVIDPTVGLPLRAWHLPAQPSLRVIASGPVGDLTEIIAGWLVLWSDYPQAGARVIATLAGRLVNTDHRQPGSWLTDRWREEIDQLARDNPAVLWRIIQDPDSVFGIDLERIFARHPEVLRAARALIGDVRIQALAASPSLRVSDTEVATTANSDGVCWRILTSLGCGEHDQCA